MIMLSGREIDGRGWPVVRKPFLEEDLAHTMKQTTGRRRRLRVPSTVTGSPGLLGRSYNAANIRGPSDQPLRHGRSGRSNVP